VQLEVDVEERDRYGRLLAYVYLPSYVWRGARSIAGGDPYMVRLTGSRVIVRSMTPDDWAPMWQYEYSEPWPEWKNWDAPYFPHEPETFEAFSERIRKRSEQTLPSMLAIEVDGRVVGTVSCYWESKETRWLEVGICIYNPACWSGGCGTEALRLWIGFLFDRLDTIARVGLTTWSGNVRMIRCAEKLGMQMEGRIRKVRYWQGEYYDSIRMGVLREEWEALEE
jgi:RimJ/RimL family protein N-acetyltransferase